MDYNSLVASKGTSGSILTFTKYNLVDVEAVLEDAQSYIYQRLRVREMRGYLTITTNTTDDHLFFTGGFLDSIYLRHRVLGIEIELLNEEQLFRRRVYDTDGDLIEGAPTAYCMISDRMVFDVQPDQEYDLDHVFYYTIGFLSAETPTTYISAKYPHILRQACVGLAGQHMKDYDEAKTALALCDAMIDDAKVQDDLARRGQR